MSRTSPSFICVFEHISCPPLGICAKTKAPSAHHIEALRTIKEACSADLRHPCANSLAP